MQKLCLKICNQATPDTYSKFIVSHINPFHIGYYTNYCSSAEAGVDRAVWLNQGYTVIQ